MLVGKKWRKRLLCYILYAKFLQILEVPWDFHHLFEYPETVEPSIHHTICHIYRRCDLPKNRFWICSVAALMSCGSSFSSRGQSVLLRLKCCYSSQKNITYTTLPSLLFSTFTVFPLALLRKLLQYHISSIIALILQRLLKVVLMLSWFLSYSY